MYSPSFDEKRVKFSTAINPELPAITNSLKMIKVAKSTGTHVRGEEYIITPWSKLMGFLRHTSRKCRKKIRKISAR